MKCTCIAHRGHKQPVQVVSGWIPGLGVSVTVRTNAGRFGISPLNIYEVLSGTLPLYRIQSFSCNDPTLAFVSARYLMSVLSYSSVFFVFIASVYIHCMMIIVVIIIKVIYVPTYILQARMDRHCRLVVYVYGDFYFTISRVMGAVLHAVEIKRITCLLRSP